MKRITGLFVFVVIMGLLVTPLFSEANSGVSINTGKIVLDQKLISGGSYDLPNMEVKNIGDEASDYEVGVQYNEVQSQIKPASNWFQFDPATFHLLPGESKIIKTKISIPVDASFGDYFAYIEAHSLSKNNGNSISGAVASKLYFSVSHFNVLKTIYYSSLSFVRHHASWAYGALWLISVVIFSFFWKRLLLIIKKSNYKK